VVFSSERSFYLPLQITSNAYWSGIQQLHSWAVAVWRRWNKGGKIGILQCWLKKITEIWHVLKLCRSALVGLVAEGRLRHTRSLRLVTPACADGPFMPSSE